MGWPDRHCPRAIRAALTATKALTEMRERVLVIQAENLRMIEVNEGYTSESARGAILARMSIALDIDDLFAALAADSTKESP